MTSNRTLRGVASPQTEPHQTSAASDGSVMTASDYADDPFKSMARKYDRRVVRKGGDSIFGRKLRLVPDPGEE